MRLGVFALINCFHSFSLFDWFNSVLWKLLIDTLPSNDSQIDMSVYSVPLTVCQIKIWALLFGLSMWMFKWAKYISFLFWKTKNHYLSERENQTANEHIKIGREIINKMCRHYKINSFSKSLRIMNNFVQLFLFIYLFSAL